MVESRLYKKLPGQSLAQISAKYSLYSTENTNNSTVQVLLQILVTLPVPIKIEINNHLRKAKIEKIQDDIITPSRIKKKHYVLIEPSRLRL